MKTKSLQNQIVEIISGVTLKIFGQMPEDLTLDFPSSVELGNFCFNCFLLAKQFNLPPAKIAEQIGKALDDHSFFEKITVVGPYVNLKVTNLIFFKTICESHASEIFEEIGQGQNVMVEYLSPNTNKPLHLGHARNGILGMAVANILEASGYKVIKSNLVNDRGVHICKSMLAWQKWGDGQTPESTGIKGDHFVGEWYVRFAKELQKNPELEDEVKEMLLLWEAGDKETLALWHRMNTWAFKGFEQTYLAYGFNFNHIYYESQTYKLGKVIVEKGLEQGLFIKDKSGAITVNLPADLFGLDSDGKAKKVTLLRADGTSVYMTQDLGTAELKFKDFATERSIYVVGSEQDYHFKCLFWILKALGFEWAANYQHLSYGMVYLPEGKMKSREGTVVDADDLLVQMTKMAAVEIQKRYTKEDFDEVECETRARKIALGAIKFYLLKFSPRSDIHFDPTSSLSFDGQTGPYCLYTYARASTILKKVGQSKLNQEIDYKQLGNKEELLLAQKLIAYSQQVKLAACELNPGRIATYVYELAQIFNQFYEKHPVIKASDELSAARVKLVESTLTVIKAALNLMGIEEIEQM